VSVVVTNTDGQSGSLSNGFTYTAASNPAPTVTSIAPNNGTTSGGTSVNITGTGFLSGATVSVGGTSATGVSVVSSTSITATTPAHSAGTASVVVTNTDGLNGTLSGGFTYSAVNPAPSVTAINPNNGSTDGGTAVTVTGTGFLAGATLSIGGTTAPGASVVSATSITATTPAHGAGPVDVVVTNSDGKKGTLLGGYTYGTITQALGLGVPSGDASSATVTAGQTASYTLAIGGAGMTGTASLSCTGAPTGTSCSVPVSEPFSSTTASTFVVNVTTTARTMGALRTPAAPSVASSVAGSNVAWTWNWAFATMSLFILPGVRIRKRSLRRWSAGKYLRLAPLALLLVLISCGGGGGGTSSPPPVNPNGTPAGTYTLNVTAISGNATQTTSLTLVVH
jgi:IPT/TIG domain-containing protein